LNPVETLRRISGSSSGRFPSFTEAHALKALELIGGGAGIGRKQLSRELGLGEGTVRTLLSRMKAAGLLETSRGGATLTSEGRGLLERFGELISAGEFPETEVTVGSRNYAILVRGAGSSVNRGIEQRDAALMAGAEGATTLVYDGERLIMPGVEMEIDPAILEHVLDFFEPGREDVVIIGSAQEPLDAEIGAKYAALKLLERVTVARKA
jgi:predicted transcriptional regulator